MEHWTRYWNTTNALNSFAEGEYSTNYQGDILHFWERILKDTPQHSTIIDLASGNGALAVLAYQYGVSHRYNFNIHAVDASDVGVAGRLTSFPSSVADALANIAFHSNTFIENMPFDDASADLLISQYGLEYSELNRSLIECARVLKAGGRLCALMHHTDSVIVKDSKAGLRVLEHLFAKNGFHTQCMALLAHARDLLGKGGSIHDDALFQTLNKQLLDTAKHDIDHFSDSNERLWFDSFLSKITPFLYRVSQDSHRCCAQYFHDLTLYRHRLKDQIHASMDHRKVTALRVALMANGFEVSFTPMYMDGNQVGIAMIAIKLS
ncbi:class I SAM-dependent methyltransferase [Shewanella sp. YIC-542]|uniref:class I SAM-dependent methyltransferase n=1 Tax=Shewanella mytili TaxID=3377111 RepID=UPI00398F31C4